MQKVSKIFGHVAEKQYFCAAKITNAGTQALPITHSPVHKPGKTTQTKQ